MLSSVKLHHLRVQTLRAYKAGDWRELPIQESGQSLVPVPEDLAYPYYARVMKVTDDDTLYLREEALDRVIYARTLLAKDGLDLRVYDGWRSTALQENLFWHYMKAFTAPKFDQKRFDELDDFSLIKSYFNELPDDLRTTMREANRTYVSWPSSDPKSPSPHATGGAVDVWLYHTDGTPANLGVPFDWMEEEAGAFYHMKRRRKRFAGNDQKVRLNRTRLLLAMSRAGFSCYGPEIWHFNFGNQMDALVSREHARYSYVEP